jgi:hypothetical protein
LTPTLYKLKRVCCVCGAEATSNRRDRIDGEPNIIAISPVVYRRGTGKGKLKSAKAVQVCEECLTRALTGGRLSWAGGDRGGWKLWAAIRSTLLDRYSDLCEADKA